MSKPRENQPSSQDVQTPAAPPPPETPKTETTSEKPAPAASAGKVWLTTRASELGPRGAFVTPTHAEVRAAPEGLLVEPTADQLAQRLA